MQLVTIKLRARISEEKNLVQKGKARDGENEEKIELHSCEGKHIFDRLRFILESERIDFRLGIGFVGERGMRWSIPMMLKKRNYRQEEKEHTRSG